MLKQEGWIVNNDLAINCNLFIIDYARNVISRTYDNEYSIHIPIDSQYDLKVLKFSDPKVYGLNWKIKEPSPLLYNLCQKSRKG